MADRPNKRLTGEQRERDVIAKREARAAARREGESMYPQMTVAEFAKRVHAAKAAGEVWIEHVLVRFDLAKSKQLIMSFRDSNVRGPRSSSDYDVVSLGGHCYRARWLVQDCLLWLGGTGGCR